MSARPKVIAIVGPTATGKTELALNLTHHFSGEIISADSRQIYQGMNVGTGKDLPSTASWHIYSYRNSSLPKLNLGYYQLNHTRIWLYDLIKPNQVFSVSLFYQLATTTIHHIWKKGKIPFLVGGTGLYLQSLVKPITTLAIPPNSQLRLRLGRHKLSPLQIMLKQLNPSRFNQMNQSDRNNPRRIIRAIEIEDYQRYRHHRIGAIKKSASTLDLLGIALTAPLEYIDAQITRRVTERIEHGMELEVETLIKQFPNWKNLPAFTSTGYKEVREYLEGKISRHQAIAKWIIAEKQYARRQITWFKKQPYLNWFDVTKSDIISTIVDYIRDWYT